MSNVYFRLRFDLVYSLKTKQQKLLRSWGKFLTLKHVSSEFTIPIGIGFVDQKLNHVFILLTFSFYISGDNICTDIFGANLYNKYLQDGIRDSAKAAAQVRLIFVLKKR